MTRAYGPAELKAIKKGPGQAKDLATVIYTYTARIWELRGQGWTHKRITAELGLSQRSVGRVPENAGSRSYGETGNLRGLMILYRLA